MGNACEYDTGDTIPDSTPPLTLLLSLYSSHTSPLTHKNSKVMHASGITIGATPTPLLLLPNSSLMLRDTQQRDVG